MHRYENSSIYEVAFWHISSKIFVLPKELLKKIFLKCDLSHQWKTCQVILHDELAVLRLHCNQFIYFLIVLPRLLNVCSLSFDELSFVELSQQSGVQIFCVFPTTSCSGFYSQLRCSAFYSDISFFPSKRQKLVSVHFAIFNVSYCSCYFG